MDLLFATILLSQSLSLPPTEDCHSAVLTIRNNWNSQKSSYPKIVPYSLKILPPSNISPPFLFAKICCGGIFYLQFKPPDHLLLNVDEIFWLKSNLRWSGIKQATKPGCLQIDPVCLITLMNFAMLLRLHMKFSAARNF